MAVSASAVLFWAAACGDQDYTADELVTDLNDHGAALELGEALPSARDGIDVYALRFPTDPSAALKGGDEEGGGGSLTITPDADAGLAEYQRCESAGTLVCFRADNGVLMFEDKLGAEERDRLASALEAIAG
jgi:hypothetical protein